MEILVKVFYGSLSDETLTEDRENPSGGPCMILHKSLREDLAGLPDPSEKLSEVLA